MLYGTSTSDIIWGYAGNDELYGASDSDTLYGGTGNDRLHGSSGKDYLWGEDGDDYLNGGGDNIGDFFYGGVGFDEMVGWTGDDRFEGGLGGDTISTGSGRDVIVYNTIDESYGSQPATRDSISDFAIALDKINLSYIDADAGTAGNQAFLYLRYATDFTGAGQLRLARNASTNYIYGNTDADADAEFALQVVCPYSLTVNDFYL